MRKAAKIDANHREIVQHLRQKAGCRVMSLAALGKGWPDIMVLSRGQLFLLEIKDGSLPPSKRRLTDMQKEVHTVWPVKVVTSIEEALTAVGAIKPRAEK